MLLKTKYDIGTIPHSEYPRPQLVRDSYLTLNGEWDLSKKCEDNTLKDYGKIIVPFSPESQNSGVSADFTLGGKETLIYNREFTLDEAFIEGATVIHFGAVDCKCAVYLNGELVCEHLGGFTPFSADVSKHIKTGINKITVECWDNIEGYQGARGKQSANPGTIWYTPQSGIWQSVWLESMPAEYIKDITVKTDPVSKTVSIVDDYNGEQTVCVYDDGKLIFEQKFRNSIEIKYDFEIWSPENPKLYDFEISTDSGDKIKSYFGVRSFGIGKDENGIARLLLNGKPYFFNGLLDQGYWSDGLLTHPCDEAIVVELTMLKNMGFNMIRKHIKLEPLRWYYHCDRLGLVVWQDFVNGGGEYKYMRIAALPFLGFKHDDSDYKYFSRDDENGRREYEAAVYETIGALKNCTCIGVWVPFNEGWGQFDSAKYTQLVKQLDDTRVIDSVSGWYDQGVGKTELKSLHTYYTPLKVPKDTRPVVLSEFGGYSLQIKDHVFSEKIFGYKVFKTEAEFCDAIEKLYLEKLMPLISKGLCACVYTQVSDVEDEINGLVTYDRKHVKIPIERMAAINKRITDEANKVK